jgi:hypothetical protein
MSQNGKGDAPRSCFSKDFKENYDMIDWSKKPKKKSKKKEKKVET